jgi:Zn-dependent protease
MNAIDVVFYIAILIMSVVIHEVSHGFMAERFGDKTARHAGRLTLNPIKHLDLFGSIILPALFYFSFGFAFGWAKPVPYNPDNLTPRKWGTFFVSAAGIMSNFLIAIIFGLVLRMTGGLALPEGFYFIISSIVMVNLGLGIFNLVPIPPLDGSKILFSLLPWEVYKYYETLERYALVLLFVFIFFFSHTLFPLLSFCYTLLTGFPLNIG